MDILQIAGICLLSLFLFTFVREFNPSFGLPLAVFIGVSVIALILPLVGEIMKYSENLMLKAVTSERMFVLYKCIGAAFLTQYVSELCVENGFASLSTKIELAGKVYITLLCLPFINELLSSLTKSLS